MERLLDAAGVTPLVPSPDGLEVVRRASASGSWLFAINHTDADLPLHATGTDLVTGEPHASGTPVPARGVVVLREA